jgi:hypothetical protein
MLVAAANAGMLVLIALYAFVIEINLLILIRLKIRPIHRYGDLLHIWNYTKKIHQLSNSGH